MDHCTKPQNKWTKNELREWMLAVPETTIRETSRKGPYEPLMVWDIDGGGWHHFGEVGKPASDETFCEAVEWLATMRDLDLPWATTDEPSAESEGLWSEPVETMDIARCRKVAKQLGGAVGTALHTSLHGKQWEGLWYVDDSPPLAAPMCLGELIATRAALRKMTGSMSSYSLNRLHEDCVWLGELADMPRREEGEEGPPPCMSCRTACTSGKDCSLWHEYVMRVGDAMLRDAEAAAEPDAPPSDAPGADGAEARPHVSCLHDNISRYLNEWKCRRCNKRFRLQEA